MKLFKDTNGVISSTMILLGLLVLVVVGIALYGIAPADEVPDDEVPDAVAGQQTGAFDVTLVDLAGMDIGEVADLDIYLTSPDVYPDVYSVFEEIDTQGKLVDPYDPSIIAGSRRTLTNSAGVASFTVTSKQWLAGDPVNVGTDFGLAIIDETPAAGGYNPEVGNIKINARLTPEQQIVVSVVDGQAGFFGSEIEVAPIGVMSYFDPVGKTDNHTGYELDKEVNDTISDDDFTVHTRLLVADTELRDVTVYVDVEEGDMGLEIDDVGVSIDGVKITGTGMTDVSDMSTTNVLKKNAPTKTGDTLYVIEGASFDMSRINDNNMVEIEIELIDYSTSTVTSAMESHVNVTLVANNGYKTSELVLDTFTFTIGENLTGGYTS